VAEIRFSKNGVDLGRAFTINPQLKSSAFFPAVVLKNAEMLFNFGELPWKYPPPQVWCVECLGSKVLKNAEMLFNFGDLPWK
jgi:ATP-dependent RNA helicase DDX1